MVETLFSRSGQVAHLKTLEVPESMVKETAPLARLKAGDYRVVEATLEVARSDGGEVSEDMMANVEGMWYGVTEGQVLVLEWGRAGLGGREQMVEVGSGGLVVASITLGGFYDNQFWKDEGYVENGRMVSVRSGTAPPGVNLANPFKGRMEIYIDEEGLLVVSRDWEVPHRIEEEEVIISRKEIVKARRVLA